MKQLLIICILIVSVIFISGCTSEEKTNSEISNSFQSNQKSDIQNLELIITDVSPADDSATVNTKPTMSAVIEASNADMEIEATMNIRVRDLNDNESTYKIVKTFQGAKRYVIEYTPNEKLPPEYPLGVYRVEVIAVGKNGNGEQTDAEKRWIFHVVKKYVHFLKTEENGYGLEIVDPSDPNADIMVVTLPAGEDIELAPNSLDCPSNFLLTSTAFYRGYRESNSSSIHVRFVDTIENERSEMKYIVSMTFSYHLKEVKVSKQNDPPGAHVFIGACTAPNMLSVSNIFFEFNAEVDSPSHSDNVGVYEKKDTITKEFHLSFNKGETWPQFVVESCASCGGSSMSEGSSEATLTIERISIKCVELQPRDLSVSMDYKRDLEDYKSKDDKIVYGADTVNYTITVTNLDSVDATDVVVNDLLPSGLKFISADPQGVYDPSTGMWNVGNLDAGASTKLIITTRVIQSGEITNIATLNEDSNPLNNEATVTFNARNPVILVHGFKSDPGTWDNLSRELKNEGIRHYTFPYSNLEDPYYVAGNFDNWVDNYLRDETWGIGYQGEFDIVCHSMGALVTRFWMEGNNNANAENVGQWIGIGPVNHGAAIVDIVMDPTVAPELWRHSEVGK